MSDVPEGAAEKKGGKMKLLIIVMGLVTVLSIGGAVTAVLMMKGGGDEDTAEAEHGKGKKGKNDAKGKKDKGGKKSADKGEDEDESEEGEEGEVTSTVEYLSLAPSFVVNFQSAQARVRFLKVDLDAVASDPLAIDEIKKHMPAVRNAIVMLLSGQQYEVLVTPEGKETLRGQVLAEVQRVLEAQTGDKTVDDIYFTSFVMQ